VTQFNIDVIPLDAYLQLWQNLPTDAIRDAFMTADSGDYYALDDTIYDDRLAAQNKFVMGFQSFFRQHRRLYYIYEQMTPIERVNFYRVWNVVDVQGEEARFNHFLATLRALHTMEASYRRAHSGFGVSSLLPVPTLERFRVTNKGSWGVTVLREAHESAAQIFRDGSAIMFEHYKKTGWRFELRHPIAMEAAVTTDELYRNRLPIHSLDITLGESRQGIYRHLASIESSTWAQGGKPLRMHFDKWMGITATAIFRVDQDDPCANVFHALSPYGLPGVLLTHNHDKLPVIHTRSQMPSIQDQWLWAQMLPLDKILDGDVTQAGLKQNYVNDDIRRLGWLS